MLPTTFSCGKLGQFVHCARAYGRDISLHENDSAAVFSRFCQRKEGEENKCRLSYKQPQTSVNTIILNPLLIFRLAKRALHKP